MSSGIEYIVIDNRKRKRKELPDLAFFRRKDYKILLKDTNINADQLKVVSIPLDKIKVNTKLFQNRRLHYAPESVKRIIQAVEKGNFNWELFDPILLYDDGKDLWILSGHSRTEAFRRLCSLGKAEFCSIPAKIIKGISLEQAIEIARKSNTLQTKEKDTERASYYREKLLKGEKLAKVREECKLLEGRNCNFILSLAYLNPNGELFETYQMVEGTESVDPLLKSAVYWIGEARKRFKKLTNFHEQEIYNWLKKNYGRGGGKIYSLQEFINRLENILNKYGDTLPERLNLEKKDYKSSYRKEFDRKLAEAEKRLNEAKKRLEEKRAYFLKRGKKGEELEKLLTNYYHDVNFWVEEILRIKGEFAKYLEAERRQRSIFDLQGLGLVLEYFDISKIKDLNDLKKQYRELALIYHPDKGGSDEAMKKINNEYDYLFEKILNGESFTDDEIKNEIEIDEKYKEIINRLIRFPGLKIEVIGSWIWVSGNTYPIRKILKDELGFRFAGKKKMWYWHSGEYRKKTRRHYTIEELRRMFRTRDVSDYEPMKELKGLGALEVLRQNQTNADFKGLKPTYLKTNYDALINRCKPAKTEKHKGDLRDTIELILKAIHEHSCEVRDLAKILKADSIRQTVFNIWHFLRPIKLGGQVNYKLDTYGTEEIRTPARTWDDRFTGVDCEDLAIFAGSVLKELGIPFKLKIVGFFGNKGYQHIFIEVPTQQGNIILDPVMQKKFDELPQNIVRTMEINYMSGLAGDTVMQEIEKIAETELAGLGAVSIEIIEAAKDLRRLEQLIEVQQMFYFANVEKEFETLEGLSGLWDKIKKGIDKIKDRIKNTPKHIREKAKKIWQKAKEKVKKYGDNAKELGQKIKKYGLAPVRGAFLLLVKVNFLGIAKKLYVGYLTETQARKYNLDLNEWKKAVEGRKKAEHLFVKWEGKKETLRKAVFSGWGKKGFEKGLKGLGDPGTATAVATAVGTSAPLWEKIWQWLKNINWKKLFKTFDKVSELLPHKQNNHKTNETERSKTSKEKTQFAEEPKKQNNLLFPLLLGSGLLFILLQ